ncbi:MAG: tRNA (adenosine(37)-N6)-threonylcarbamoyltransferase complex ATPase subunit type 1 TsaE [Thermosulfidibacteraceae bacterium]|jgi:tRNA threonylcarbamoyladenosine biosynthesis protein TsaE
MIVVTRSEEETIELGRKLGKELKRGDLVLLGGELGAGKTRIVKGIASSLEVDEVVTSPTFTLVNEYPCKAGILFHVDLYRLDSFPKDDIDIDDLLDRGIVVVEWWERDRNFFELARARLIVNIKILSEEEREIEVKWFR